MELYDILTKTFFAFLIGGIFCTIAQILIDKTALTPARILVFYVCTGVALGALGIYDKIFALAGCGISVPLIGFGAVISEGVKRAIDTEGILGVLKGPFTAAAAGCSAALIFGYINALLFKGKPKRM